jgi:hypothetical protein
MRGTPAAARPIARRIPKYRYNCHSDWIRLRSNVPTTKMRPPTIMIRREPERSLSAPNNSVPKPNAIQLTIDAAEIVPRSQPNCSEIGLNITPNESTTPNIMRLKTRPAKTITQP